MWHWLVNAGHLYSALVGWAVGFSMASLLGVGLSRPIIVRVRQAFRDHEKTQKKIADHLDTTTPGGLGVVVQKLEDLKTTMAQKDVDVRGQE